MLNKYSFQDNNGHADWSGLAWLFILACITVILGEGALIAITLIWWKYTVVRITFGILAILGAVLITKTIIDLLD